MIIAPLIFIYTCFCSQMFIFICAPLILFMLVAPLICISTCLLLLICICTCILSSYVLMQCLYSCMPWLYVSIFPFNIRCFALVSVYATDCWFSSGTYYPYEYMLFTTTLASYLCCFPYIHFHGFNCVPLYVFAINFHIAPWICYPYMYANDGFCLMLEVISMLATVAFMSIYVVIVIVLAPLVVSSSLIYIQFKFFIFDLN